jgi:hypothetical protein
MRARVFLPVFLVACGGGAGVDGGATHLDAGAGCPNDLPASCPQAVPLYSTGTSPVLRELCVGCHSAGGEAANRPLDTYAAVFSRRSSVLNQVNACVMPPPGHPQPSPVQRQALLEWLVCGAPDN